MIDECHFLSKKIPPCNKYKIHNLEVTKARILKANFNDKSTSAIGERMKKIEKVAEDNLEPFESYKKSQLSRAGYSCERQKRVCYFDEKVAKKKFIPGVGSYFKKKKGQ